MTHTRSVLAAVGIALLASTSMHAQVVEAPTGPAVGQAVPQTTGATVSPAAAEADQAASAARMKEQERLAEEERKASEKRIEEQEKQLEKERKAAEKQAEAERKAAEKAAAEAAAAEKLAADRAAADAAAREKAATAAPVAVPLSKDSRDRVVQICTAEAQRRGAAVGAADVSLEEVQDTDVKSDGRASMQARMTLVTKDSKGRVKTSKKKVSCETKNNVVTKFKVS